MISSLEIVLDVLALRERYGDAIIYLCGNHELPHIYGFVLGKGAVEYTSGFEAALSRSGRRRDILALLDSLPFFLCTAAGVCITHAGASAPLADSASAAKLFDWGIGRCAAGPTRSWRLPTAPSCAAAMRASAAKSPTRLWRDTTWLWRTPPTPATTTCCAALC